MDALDRYRAERLKRHHHAIDPDAPPERTVRMGEEAAKIADVPHLTGDPEGDAIELEETRPGRPYLYDARG